MAQITSVSQFSDVKPTDWAFQALQSLVERYGCIVGYPDKTYLFNGSYIAAAQLTLSPSKNFDIGLNYAYSYHQVNILGTGYWVYFVCNQRRSNCQSGWGALV